MLSSKYWCYLQTCGNMWHFSWHRRIHWVYDWVYDHRAPLLHVWCRSAYYSWQVSLPKLLDGERYIVLYHLLPLICYSKIPTLSYWAPQQCKFPKICSNIFKNLLEKPHTNECLNALTRTYVLHFKMGSWRRERFYLKSLVYFLIYYGTKLQIYNRAGIWKR